MTDEPKHIATAAALLDDPYAALSQHLHGDGDTPTSETSSARPMPNAAILICRVRPGGRLIVSAAEAVVVAWRARALEAEAEVERLRAAIGKEVMPDASTRPIQQPDTSPRLTAGAQPVCATPGCTNPPGDPAG